jgi:hypothetical protein
MCEEEVKHMSGLPADAPDGSRREKPLLLRQSICLSAFIQAWPCLCVVSELSTCKWMEGAMRESPSDE